MAALRSWVSVRRRVKYKVDASHTAKITRKPASNAALIVRGGRTTVTDLSGRSTNRSYVDPTRPSVMSGVGPSRIQPPRDTGLGRSFLELRERQTPTACSLAHDRLSSSTISR